MTLLRQGYGGQGTPTAENPGPSLVELQALAALCSDREWDRLLVSPTFLEKTRCPLHELETFMSQQLGRKIAVGSPAVSNPGDETL